MGSNRFNDAASVLVQYALRAGESAGTIVTKAKAAATTAAAEGMKAAAAKRTEMRLKKYQPLFAEDIVAPGFDVPRMIIIADEDERKGIDVCEEAVGWTELVRGMEVLHIHDDCTHLLNLEFYPPAMCDMAFYIDPTDSRRYLAVNEYFEIIRSDQLVELQVIAHSLGAKKCEVKVYELEKTMVKKDKRVDAHVNLNHGGMNPSVAAEGALVSSARSETESSVIFCQEFEGSDEPVVPDLHWYAHDKGIRSLIDGRISDLHRIKRRSVEVNNSLAQSFVLQSASKIDAALKKNRFECNFRMEDEATHEARKRFIFDVEF